MEAIAIYGSISPEEVAEAIKRYFPERTLRLEESYSAASPPSVNDIAVISKKVNMSRENELQAQVTRKEKELREMETSNTKALASIQAFHKQQQALFDEFVLLRQRYDEQKASLLSILWLDCGKHHPELRQIPFCEDENSFIETDEQVGIFSIGDVLGEGQFATVKSCWRLEKGRHSLENEEFALKIIKKERITTFQSLRRVSNEIEILRRLKSKYIVGVHEVFQTQKKLYIVTEKGGSDLFEFFDEHPNGVPELWAKEIVACVLKAVRYCHEQGVCHRGKTQDASYDDMQS